MSSDYINEITDAMIQAQLDSVVGATVEWVGHMPSDAERYDDAAEANLSAVTVAEVFGYLQRYELGGDDAAHEIDMAISIAAEPDDLPENAIVMLYR